MEPVVAPYGKSLCLLLGPLEEAGEKVVFLTFLRNERFHTIELFDRISLKFCQTRNPSIKGRNAAKEAI